MIKLQEQLTVIYYFESSAFFKYINCHNGFIYNSPYPVYFCSLLNLSYLACSCGINVPLLENGKMIVILYDADMCCN